MRVLKVKELIEILGKTDPEAAVVVPGRDHDYAFASAECTTALRKGHDMCEDHGDQYTPEGEEYGKRVNVVVIS